jgi:antitoxin FitA
MRAAEVIDMSSARVNVEDMSKMIQIRNVPDDLHRTLKIRAAEEGMTLSDYIKRELGRVSRQTTLAELRAWRRSRPPSGMTTQGIVDAIREVRGD